MEFLSMHPTLETNSVPMKMMTYLVTYIDYTQLVTVSILQLLENLYNSQT